MMKKLNKIINLLFLFTAISFFTACSYESDFDYQKLMSEHPGITVENFNSTLVVSPASSESALIFYPGALVSYEAYLPLMVRCAEKGIKCFLLQMPEDLAITKIEAASHYIEYFSEIKNWYIGGHSLGGAMAAYYASKNADKLKGLVLLAAYSTQDLKESGLKVLSIYGSNDGVLKIDNYNADLSNLPSDFEEHVIEGGNHAQFASYGFQKGDKKATISSDQQKDLTATWIGNFCK